MPNVLPPQLKKKSPLKGFVVGMVTLIIKTVYAFLVRLRRTPPSSSSQGEGTFGPYSKKRIRKKTFFFLASLIWSGKHGLLAIPRQKDIIFVLPSGHVFIGPKMGDRLMDIYQYMIGFSDTFFEKEYDMPGRGDFVVDVGAWIGDSTVRLAERHANKAVIAFEPLDFASRFIPINAALNGLNNVIVASIGLSNEEGEKELYTPEETWYITATMTRPKRGRRITKIRVTTLDKVKSQLPGKIAVIKIDAEGHEREILEGALRTLKTDRPSLVIAAYHYKGEVKEVLRVLRKAGYKKLHVKKAYGKFPIIYAFSD